MNNGALAPKTYDSNIEIKAIHRLNEPATAG
jgi:hypothetical protein